MEHSNYTVTVPKSELDRMDRTIEQIRDRMNTNFDAINSLLREVASNLSSLSTQMPLQKEAIDALKSNVKELEFRVSEIENNFAKAKGMTVGAKWLWGVIIAFITFVVTNAHHIVTFLHKLAGIEH